VEDDASVSNRVDFVRLCVARSSTAFSFAKKTSMLVQLCFSKHFTPELADKLLPNVKMGDDEMRQAILNEMQDQIACNIVQGSRDGDDPVLAAGLLYIWESVLESCEKAGEVLFASAMVEMLLTAIDNVCSNLNDSYSLMEHYKQYEQLGVLGHLVRAAVVRLQEGAVETRDDRSRALRAITNRIGKLPLSFQTDATPAHSYAV
jgi:hypothetical protein